MTPHVKNHAPSMRNPPIEMNLPIRRIGFSAQLRVVSFSIQSRELTRLEFNATNSTRIDN